MTKLGASFDQKDQSEKIPIEETTAPQEQPKPTKNEEVNLQEILVAVGLDPGRASPECARPSWLTMDWGAIRRATVAQIVLTMISLFCLMWTAIFGHMTSYKFTACTWTMFLFVTGLVGHRGAQRRSYAYVVAYCIMSAFQTLLHWGSVAWLVYMIACIDRYTETPQHRGDNVKLSFLLLLELAESLALLGTVLTGLMGLIACCKGFGRLLEYQDRNITSQQKPEIQMDPVTETEESTEQEEPAPEALYDRALSNLGLA